MKAKCVAVIIILVVCLVQSDVVPGVPIFCPSNFCLCHPIMIVHTFPLVILLIVYLFCLSITTFTIFIGGTITTIACLCLT